MKRPAVLNFVSFSGLENCVKNRLGPHGDSILYEHLTALFYGRKTPQLMYFRIRIMGFLIENKIEIFRVPETGLKLTNDIITMIYVPKLTFNHL